MTQDQAKKILERPKFGDPLCIAAIQTLKEADEETRLRTIVIGKKITCGACGRDTDAGCECCDHGWMVITKELAACWDLDILQGVIEELELKP